MLLSEYIKMLEEVLEEHGDAPVFMTQRGYYADGEFADLYESIDGQTTVKETHYEKGVRKDVITTGYELGHSYQNY